MLVGTPGMGQRWFGGQAQMKNIANSNAAQGPERDLYLQMAAQMLGGQPGAGAGAGAGAGGGGSPALGTAGGAMSLAGKVAPLASMIPVAGPFLGAGLGAIGAAGDTLQGINSGMSQGGALGGFLGGAKGLMGSVGSLAGGMGGMGGLFGGGEGGGPSLEGIGQENLLKNPRLAMIAGLTRR